MPRLRSYSSVAQRPGEHAARAPDAGTRLAPPTPPGSPATPNTPFDPRRGLTVWGPELAAFAVLLGALVLVQAHAVLALPTGVTGLSLAGSVIVWAALGALLIARTPSAHCCLSDPDAFPCRERRFGRGPHPGGANRVTLARTALVVAFAALAALPVLGALDIERFTAAWHWIWLVGVLALVLDAADGFVARRTASASRFGARFDMEVDAAFLLVLALFAWWVVGLPVWVLLIGLARYVFVAAAAVWPWLLAPLPFSQRRRVIAAVQGVVLIVVIAPLEAQTWNTALAALATLALLVSFAIDVRGQYQRHRKQGA